MDQCLYNAHEEGRQAVTNKRKKSVINPYLDGTDVAKEWDRGMREQLEKEKV
jgi:hypothetical protein